MNNQTKRNTMSKRVIRGALVLAMAAFAAGGFTGHWNASASGGAKASSEQTVQALDDDPMARRNQVDYNYDYEGEGDNAVLSSVTATNAIVKTPFTASTYRHASKFSGYKVAYGIDVSYYQGNINWSRVKRAGVEYAIIRVGYCGAGTGALRSDPKYMTYIKGALKAGLKVGVYIYSQAITPAEARQEANFVLKRIQGYDISMPVVLDYEFYTSTSGRLAKANLTKREGTDVCEAFCRTVENAGYTPMVYGNCDMFNNHLYGEEIAENAMVWLANFGLNNGKDRGFATSYKGTYSFWQYTSRGKVSGISGYVDCNFWYQTSAITNQAKVATKLNITDESVTVKSGDTAYLYHSIEPSGCVDDITWTSSKPSVAYVKDGYVYGVSGGETTITATTSSGATDICRVTVLENMNHYTIQCEDSVEYTGLETKPEITVRSKAKRASSGKTKEKLELFAGPGDAYKVACTIPKRTALTIYASEGDYYAASVTLSGKTYYGYCLASGVSASKSYISLVQDRDYTIKYSSNTNAGTALVEAAAANGSVYSGTISQSYTIKPISINKVSIDSISSQTTATSPQVTVRYQGVILKEGTDYTLSYSNTVADASAVLGTSTAVSAAVTISGAKNLTGSRTLNYEVGSSTIASVDAVAAQDYTGEPITPELTVRDASGAVLVKDVDYLVVYSDNVEVGNGKAVVTPLVKTEVDGAQTTNPELSCYTVYFPIWQQNIADAAVSVSGTYTYNQKAQKASVSVKLGGKSLKEGTDYRLEYDNNCLAGDATVRVIGMGQYRGSKEVTYKIAPASFRQVECESVASQSYAAGSVTPSLKLKDGDSGLLQGVDYTVTYTNNRKLGKAKVTITGKGNYTGTKTMQFRIVKKSVSSCKITKIGNYKYKKGRRIKPSVTIRNNGQKLKLGRDYTVSYGKNTKVGKATVTITGKGNYTGRKKIVFRIVR